MIIDDGAQISTAIKYATSVGLNLYDCITLLPYNKPNQATFKNVKDLTTVFQHLQKVVGYSTESTAKVEAETEGEPLHPAVSYCLIFVQEDVERYINSLPETVPFRYAFHWVFITFFGRDVEGKTSNGGSESH